MLQYQHLTIFRNKNKKEKVGCSTKLQKLTKTKSYRLIPQKRKKETYFEPIYYFSQTF